VLDYLLRLRPEPWHVAAVARATRHRSASVAARYVRPSEALANKAHRAAADALAGDG
jgi:hypothetical protein